MEALKNNEIWGVEAWKCLCRVRQLCPLIQCVTNYVSMDIMANTLLAAGASPAMVHALEEISDFTPQAQGLCINIGTLTSQWVSSMKLAAVKAVEAQKPWVLDPVAVGVSKFRLEMCIELLSLKPTVIRGNASEILALAGASVGPSKASVLEILEVGVELLTAARRGDLQTVISRLKKGAPVNKCDQYGWTALHCAALKGHVNVLAKLIVFGADVLVEDTEGHTALHCAVEGGRKEAIKFLLEKGTKINAKSKRGATSLYMLAAMGYLRISRFLLNQGADTTSLHHKPIPTSDSHDSKQKNVSFEGQWPWMFKVYTKLQ